MKPLYFGYDSVFMYPAEWYDIRPDDATRNFPCICKGPTLKLRELVHHALVQVKTHCNEPLFQCPDRCTHTIGLRRYTYDSFPECDGIDYMDLTRIILRLAALRQQSIIGSTEFHRYGHLLANTMDIFSGDDSLARHMSKMKWNTLPLEDTGLESILRLEERLQRNEMSIEEKERIVRLKQW
jgi:hypothetical protein